MRRQKPPDPKLESLRRHGALNPRPQSVSDELLLTNDFFDARDLVQVKYEMLRQVQKDGQPVTGATRAFGFSRPSFYNAQGDFAREGLAGLVPRKRGRRKAHKLTEEVMELIDHMREEKGRPGSAALALRIKEELGLAIHPRSIERALQRREKKRR